MRNLLLRALLSFLQAALAELEEPHQRPDPRMECPGTDPGRKVSSRNIRKISGANLYSRLNYWIVKCGGVALATPPNLVGVEAPAEAELDLSAEAFTFQLTDMPEATDDIKFVILASAPQSNGVTRAYSKAVQIGDPRDVVDGAIDIKTDYEAVHGAVTEAAPKVFVKYFYVNTTTGEKSGEMMAMISL